MNTVTFSIADRAELSRSFVAAMNGEPQGNHISFASVELLWQTLARKRLEIIHAMTGQGVLAIREVARRVRRDVKAVPSDLTALLNAGALDKADGGVIFPYDAVHVDFMLTKAA